MISGNNHQPTNITINSAIIIGRDNIDHRFKSFNEKLHLTWITSLQHNIIGLLFYYRLWYDYWTNLKQYHELTWNWISRGHKYLWRPRRKKIWTMTATTASTDMNSIQRKSKLTDSIALRSRRHIPWCLYMSLVPMNGISAMSVPWILVHTEKQIKHFRNVLFTASTSTGPCP